MGRVGRATWVRQFAGVKGRLGFGFAVIRVWVPRSVCLVFSL